MSTLEIITVVNFVVMLLAGILALTYSKYKKLATSFLILCFVAYFVSIFLLNN